MPVILDEVLESPEAVTLRYEESYEGGLLACSDLADLLPMSTYGKSQSLDFNGFDTNRSFSDPMFGYTAPPYASQPTCASVTPYQNATQMTHLSYGDESRGQFDDQAGPYLNVGSTPTPQILSYQPTKGTPGTRLFVRISSLYDVTTASTPSFFLMFGSRKCAASLTKINQHGGVCQYTVTAHVPDLDTTGWSSQVSIYMLMESSDGEIISKVDVGTFDYIERDFQGAAAQKKRKGSSELIRDFTKRPANHQLQVKEEFSTYGYDLQGLSQYQPYHQITNPFDVQTQYGRSDARYQLLPGTTHHVRQSSTMSSPVNKMQSPSNTTWNSSKAIGSFPKGGPNTLDPAARPSLTTLPSPLPTNPRLMRTSTIPQILTPATTPAGAPGIQPWNPYSLYPHKAVLKIEGQLDAIGNVDNWTIEEWNAKRRIVLFHRSQEGSTITTSFAPIRLGEQPRNSICISCIYWDRPTGEHGDTPRSECFVTSVDTIYLLESLVGARFTVDEKNRIRRNLEGFHPYTVSKSKDESMDFFKTIMAFGDPKPRHIEKDVKVFPWKILSLALKKIIGKYSSTPASTLPPTPLSTTGYATEKSASTVSRTSETQNLIASPLSVTRSISGNSVSTMYIPSVISQSMSPPSLKGNIHPHIGSTGASPLPPHNFEMSGFSPSYGDDHWSAPIVTHPSLSNSKQNGRAQHHMLNIQDPRQYQLGISNDGMRRSSWDMGSMNSFLEAGPASSASAGTAGTILLPSQSLSYSQQHDCGGGTATK